MGAVVWMVRPCWETPNTHACLGVSQCPSALCVQMDALFDAGVEVAYRLGYDDVNESLCRRDVLGRLLRELGVQR